MALSTPHPLTPAYSVGEFGLLPVLAASADTFRAIDFIRQAVEITRALDDKVDLQKVLEELAVHMRLRRILVRPWLFTASR